MSTTVQKLPGLTRIDLQRHDLSVSGYEVLQDIVEISPEAAPIRHKHPGEEVIYVLTGSLEYAVDGEPTKTYNEGESLTVPAETIHSVRNVGGGRGAELGTYFIEKGKPFLTVVE